jgi:hypothetical protein
MHCLAIPLETSRKSPCACAALRGAGPAECFTRPEVTSRKTDLREKSVMKILAHSLLTTSIMLNEIATPQSEQARYSANHQPANSQNDEAGKALKKTKISYWIGVALIALPFLASGIMEVTRNPQALALTTKLGYPPYFIFLLGIAKITGIAVLLIPNKLLWLKEWVFAGLVFDVLFAFASNYELGQPSDCVKAVVAFTFVLITYGLFRQIHPRLESPFA